MAGPLNIALKALRFAGNKTVLRAAGWAGALITIGEIGWFAAKKGKVLERFTHYYCEEGPVTCGKMIPDDLVEAALCSQTKALQTVKIKCPHCPQGKRTVNMEEWEKMKAQRKQWK